MDSVGDRTVSYIPGALVPDSFFTLVAECALNQAEKDNLIKDREGMKEGKQVGQ